MKVETNLKILLETLQPVLNLGDYVFCTINDLNDFDIHSALMMFKEAEAITIVLKKEIADDLNLDYAFVASWITLSVYSSLEAVGLTAAFSKALSENGISCNVIAAYHHDHIFVNKKDSDKTMSILSELSNKN